MLRLWSNVYPLDQMQSIQRPYFIIYCTILMKSFEVKVLTSLFLTLENKLVNNGNQLLKGDCH